MNHASAQIANSALLVALTLPLSLLAADTTVKSQSDSARLAVARKILREVPLIDGHNDLPWQFRERTNDRGDINLLADNRKLEPVLATDIPRLRAGGLGAQFWSVFVPGTLTNATAVQMMLEQIDLVHRLVARYPRDFELALTAADLQRIHRRGKIASLIGMEGGRSIGNSLGVLRMAHALGARYLTLTHNQTVDWADAATDESRHHGLAPFGETVVREMNRLGMLVDLSHVSPETMHAAIKVSQSPVILSHSNARAVCQHLRNVPDDVLRLLPTNGGVVMVCFVPGFVTEAARLDREWIDAETKRLEKLYPDNPARVEQEIAVWRKTQSPPKPPTLNDVADHIDHIRKVAGIDHVGIGSDFDGYRGVVKGLEDVSCYPALLAELLRRGYTKEEVKKVAGLNLLRVMREAEKVSARLQKAKP